MVGLCDEVEAQVKQLLQKKIAQVRQLLNSASKSQLRTGLILLYMCPHTATIYVSSH